MLRFKVGDLAVLFIGGTAFSNQFVGRECEVTHVGPWVAGQKCQDGGYLDRDADYSVMFDDGIHCNVIDIQLRKKNPPPEPASLTRHAEDECTA